MQTIHVFDPDMRQLCTSYGPCVVVPSAALVDDGHHDIAESVKRWAIRHRLIAPNDEVAVFC